MAAARRAAADFLSALGIAVDREDLRGPLLPFSGVAHVGYLPGKRIRGLPKLARLVEQFAARPQVQEWLTKQVAESLAARLRSPGVGAVPPRRWPTRSGAASRSPASRNPARGRAAAATVWRCGP
jgi:hypothetical protein